MSNQYGSMPFRNPHRQQSRQMSVDPHNELNVEKNHYIGIDVGTGSARACIMNDKGDIVGLASENIGLWQPETGYYVRELCHLTHFTQQSHDVIGTINHQHLAMHLLLDPASHVSAQHRPKHNPRHWL
jgi:hypothetical protein